MSESKTLIRIVKLLDALLHLQIAQIFKSEFNNPDLIKIWDLTGKLGAREIAKKLGLGKHRVSDIGLSETASSSYVQSRNHTKKPLIYEEIEY